MSDSPLDCWNWEAIAAVGTWAAVIAALGIALFRDSILRCWMRPRLEIEFHLGPPYCHLTTIRVIERENAQPVERYYPIYYFRFRVLNFGKTQARFCEAVLEGLWYRDAAGGLRQEQDFSPVNLTWSSVPAEFRRFRHVNPEARLYCDIGHVAHPASPLQTQSPDQNFPWARFPDDRQLAKFHFDLEIAPFSQPFYLRPGGYRIRVAIYSENASRIQRDFDITWSGNWRERAEEMFRECVIEQSR